MSSCYCSITECTKRQCKGMSKWIKKKFRSNPSNMCFALNLFYLFRNIINLYYISPFYTCQPVHSVKEQLFHYIVLCFIKLQILARIFSFSLLRSQYNFCSGLRTWKFWQILLILLNISVLITGHVEHDIIKCLVGEHPDILSYLISIDKYWFKGCPLRRPCQLTQNTLKITGKIAK